LRLAAGALVLASTLFGQSVGDSSKGRTSSSSSSSSSESEGQKIRRVWVGLSANYLPLKPLKVSNTTNSTTGVNTFSTNANGQLGGGMNVNVRVYGSFWLSFGGVYRFAGYDTNTSLNDTAETAYVERTRARLLDFPLLVRYADSRFRWSKYSFYEVGGVARYATSVKTTFGASDLSGFICCAPASTTNIKKMVEGVTVGTGLVGKDDFGIKVAPEVRYVRWFGDTFRGPTLASQRDQLEVVISFGF
jgi:hypothetical protein